MLLQLICQLKTAAVPCRAQHQGRGVLHPPWREPANQAELPPGTFALGRWHRSPGERKDKSQPGRNDLGHIPRYLTTSPQGSAIA